MSNYETDDTEAQGTNESSRGGREVVVPMALYKRVTVFGTLLAIVTVLFGFMALDAAMYSRSLVRVNVMWILERVGLGTPTGVLSAGFAVIGLTLVVLGAWIYVLSTRFRTEGMGQVRDDPAAEVDDG
ncbi:MAG: putative membrane protein [Halobacteriales archaeon]|jgi:uncharacterized membrane protein